MDRGIIGASRAYRDVYLMDPEQDPDAPSWRVELDDESIDQLVAKVGSAVDRARALGERAREASTPEERAEVARMTARLQKRVITAFIGPEGYDALLAWMGGGEPVDPERHTVQLGDVFAYFMQMLADVAGNRRLVECGIRIDRDAGNVAELNRAARRAKKKRK